MVNFQSENDFVLDSEKTYKKWLADIAIVHGKLISDLGYVFCSDSFLYQMNKEYLNHDTYTDVITFDYVEDDLIKGEIYISTDRVTENAIEFNVQFDHELKRVMAHGLLHLCGYGDRNSDEIIRMRELENNALKMFHVKQ